MSFYDDASLVFLPSGGAGKDGKAYSMKPVPEYGTNLVTNGSFDTDSDWTKGTGWTISGGTANCDGTQTGNTLLYQNIGHSSNTLYRLQFTISNYVSGTIDFALDNPFFGAANSNGTFVFDITPSSVGNFIVRADENFVGSIDNVSVKEITTSGDFDFSRGSNLTATRVDSNGLIEKGRENLLVNSVWDGVTTDTKPTGWTFQLVSGTGTFDVTATEGQIRFQTLDASSRAFIYSPTITTNGIVVASVYVDEVTTAMPLSDLLSRSANATDLFAYEDGVEINYSDNVQAGKRYSVVFNKTASTNFRFGVGVSSATLGDIVLSRPQIEVGLVATEYIESGATKGKAGLLEQEPRFDYSGGASCPSLLLEPSRTNVIGYSEYFDSWTKVGSPTITNNYGISPEGVQNSTRFEAISDRITYDLVTINANETFSIYMKGSGTLRMEIGSDNFYPSVTSEWVRYEFTTTQVGSRNVQIRGNGSAVDVELYGAQYERNSYPTSYIPNHSGGSVTRDADFATKTGLTSSINSTEGTMFLDFKALANTLPSEYSYFSMSDGTYNNRIAILQSIGATNEVRVFAFVGGTKVFDLSDSVTDITTQTKVALRYAENAFDLFVNGAKVLTDTSGSIFPANTLDRVSFSEIGTNAKTFKGKVNQTLVFPTTLSTTDLEILTGATSYESFSAMATALNYTTYE